MMLLFLGNKVFGVKSFNLKHFVWILPRSSPGQLILNLLKSQQHLQMVTTNEGGQLWILCQVGLTLLGLGRTFTGRRNAKLRCKWRWNVGLKLVWWCHEQLGLDRCLSNKWTFSRSWDCWEIFCGAKLRERWSSVWIHCSDIWRICTRWDQSSQGASRCCISFWWSSRTRRWLLPDWLESWSLFVFVNMCWTYLNWQFLHHRDVVLVLLRPNAVGSVNKLLLSRSLNFKCCTKWYVPLMKTCGTGFFVEQFWWWFTPGAGGRICRERSPWSLTGTAQVFCDSWSA